jgi:Ca2+-binding RTX toxin-like protein
MTTGTTYTTATLEAEGVSDVAYSPDQELLYAAMRNGDLEVFDVGSQQKLQTWHVGSALGAISVSQDGSFVLITNPTPASGTSSLYRVDTNNGATQIISESGYGAFRDVQVVDQDHAIISGGQPYVTDLNLHDGTFSNVIGATSYSNTSTIVRNGPYSILAEPGISDGPLFIYSNITHTIVASGDDYQASVSSGFNWGGIAISAATGMVAQHVTYTVINIYDQNLHGKQVISVGDYAFVDGISFDSSGKHLFAYLIESGYVAEFDTTTWQKVDQFYVGTSQWHNNVGYGNQLLVSDSGKYISVLDYSSKGALHLVSISSGDDLTKDNILIGTAENDTLNGLLGNDTIEGGAGNDQLDGGPGVDAVSYQHASAGVHIDLTINAAQDTGGAGIDTLSGFENIIGSEFGDLLRVGAGDHTIQAGGGDDTIISQWSSASVLGGAGDDRFVSGAAADTFDGGAGNDTVDYSAGAVGQWVDLRINAGSGGDTLISVESVVGSAYADTITGSDSANTLDGGAGGNDVLNGGGGNDLLISHWGSVSVLGGDGDDRFVSGAAADTFDGGAGNDTVDYSAGAVGQWVDLRINAGSGGDSLISVESVVGSAYADTITGSDGANTLDGGAGNDLLDGAGGVDTVSYASATAAVTVSLGQQAVAQDTHGAGVDTLKGFENLTGSAFNDQLNGDGFANVIQGGAGNDTIEGGAGDDVLDGGAGVNLLSYYHATAGVTVDLTLAGPQNTGAMGVDTLSNFQNLNGSAYGDTLRAGTGAHAVAAFGGDDLIYIDNGASGSYDGGAGNDTLSFAKATQGVTASLAVTSVQATGIGSMSFANFEAIVGSAYADSLTGSALANTLTGAGGADTLAGGAGADVFRYLLASDSTVAASDRINDFVHGTDKLNLTAVRTGASDGYAISTVGSNTQLDVDLHGDGSIDMRILLVGKGVLTSADLVW